MNLIADQQVDSITVEAVITRADGTVEDLGVIASAQYVDGRPPATPLERLAAAIKAKWAGLRRKP